MIRYVTLHQTGSVRRWNASARRHDMNPSKYTLKYFDPADPLENLTAEFVESKEKPVIPPEECLIKIEDAQLYDWTLRNATPDMRAAVEALMLGNVEDLYPFIDMWSDLGFMDCEVFGEPMDHRKLLLFLFWERRKIGFNKRLFKECYPPFKPRRSFRDET
jgi:hypothetical protein